MSKNILVEYCKKAIDILEEAGGRKRTGQFYTATRKNPRSSKPVKQTQAFSKGDLREDYHEPLILSILDDVSETELDHYLVFKDFVAFAEPGFEKNYVKKRFTDVGDAFGLFTYKMSKRDYEDIEIGRKKDPVIIPIIYVLASDIIDNSAALNDKSFKRRYSSDKGYMFTSTITRENIQIALEEYGLSSVGIDIKDIDDDEDIEKKFVSKFSILKWKKTLRRLGYTPGITEKEAYKIVQQNQGVRRDVEAESISKTNDLHGIMASHDPETYYLSMNKQEFDDAVEALAVMISSENIIFTLGFAIKNWSKWAGLSEEEMENIISLSMNGNYDEAEVEIRKFMAKGYHSFMDEKIIRDPSLADIKIKKKIEVDEKGFPINLSDKELSDYYGVIWRDINFVEFVLPHIIAKSKKEKKSSYNPMSTPPVPEWALRGNTAFERAFVKSWRRNYR